MTSRDLSPRKARVCTKSGCGRRNFGSLTWACPEHGNFHTVDQLDHKYFGVVPTLRPPMKTTDLNPTTGEVSR